MSTVALSVPRPNWRSIRTGVLAAGALALGYSLIVGLGSRSWSHLLAQWRLDAWLIALVTAGFGAQMALYSHVRRVVRSDGSAAAVATGGTATSTTAMVACCLHHLSDVVPFLGLSGAATFLIQYKVPVVVLSLAANGVGIALMLRTLRHVQRAAPAPACH